jgi:hypothetical protein
MSATYQEVMVRSDDHVKRLVAELIREWVRFAVKPEPDGWWRVRAWYRHPSLTEPLETVHLATLASETLMERP